MEKIIRHDYIRIHNALNKIIIADAKAALKRLPEKRIESSTLCRVIMSDGGIYEPADLCVNKVWLADDGLLHMAGHVEFGNYDAEYTEEDDMLDITDFAYMIDQIALEIDVDLEVKHDTIYDSYQEIKQREIAELKEAVMKAGGEVEFKEDEEPIVMVNFDDYAPHPADVIITRVRLKDGKLLIDGFETYESRKYEKPIEVNDIAYGHLDFITQEIP